MKKNIGKNNPKNKEMHNKELIYDEKMLNENQTNFFKNPDFNLGNLANNHNFNNNYINNNIMNNEIKNLDNQYNITESIESSLSTNLYEKNINLLKDKIKKQEDDIKYLENRLKNYDMCVDQITQLNIEINKLNAIINNKNKTIQEFRAIADLSKNKIEELIQNKKELIKKINFLEIENQKLNKLNKYNENSNIKNNYSNIGNIKIEDYNKLKYDLNQIIEENKRLKEQINEKDEKMKYYKNSLEKSQIQKNNRNNLIYNYDEEKIEEPHSYKNFKKINTSNKRTYYIQKRSPTPIVTNIYNERNIIPKNEYNRKDYSFRTETNDPIYLTSNHSKRMLTNFHNKYNYLKNKYRANPLDYSNYLLDNLQDNISKHYNA